MRKNGDEDKEERHARKRKAESRGKKKTGVDMEERYKKGSR